MSIINVPFSCVALDVVGSLPKSSTGNQYIPLFIDYMMHYPNANPFHSVTALLIAEELVKWVF